MSQIADLMKRQSAELAGLSLEQQRAALKLYREARGELLQRLEVLEGETFTTQNYRVALVQIEAGIRHLAIGLNHQLSRTETIEAYSVAFQSHLHQAVEKEPKLQKQWSATLEARTCMVCAQLDGQTVPVKGLFRLPNGSFIAGPTAHPNCMCALVAW